MTPTFKGTVTNGKLKIADSRFKMWVGQFEGEVEVKIDRPSNDRTSKQNKMYWAYLTLIETETGNEAGDIHEYCKRKFLQPEIKVIFGENVKLPASTTKLTTIEFSTYMEKICALTEIPIPQI